MDICSHIDSLCGFCLDAESNYEAMGGFSVDELTCGAIKILNIQENEEIVSGSLQNENIFDKLVPISCSSKILSSSVQGELKGDKNIDVITSEALKHDDNDKSNASSSLAKPLMPISAMKGSREKNGIIPPQQLTVKWAPDVYDPVPTSSLHMAVNRPRRHGKKKSKSKQKDGNKDKSSRGSKEKDKNKKQIRKRIGPGPGPTSNMGFKLCEKKEEVVNIQASANMNFHLGIPDRFCGGSFVNRCGSGLHISSFAEAT